MESMASIIQRALDFTIKLGTGSFGESGADTVKLTGLRATAIIEKNGIPSMNKAVIRIFGCPPSVMDQVSRIGVLPTAVRDNLITVTAGSGGDDMALAFAGGIWEAWPDFMGAPNVALNVIAYTALLAQMKPVLPESYPGPIDVATVMGVLARKMGFTLENNGVNVRLGKAYLPGTARAQALALAEWAGIYVAFDDDAHIMAIMPKDGVRSGAAVAISPSSGLVGFPMYVGPGQIRLRTIYNPNIRFLGSIEVQSSLAQANGRWRVNNLVHHLESETPNGAWFSDMQGNLFLAGR